GIDGDGAQALRAGLASGAERGARQARRTGLREHIGDRHARESRRARELKLHVRLERGDAAPNAGAARGRAMKPSERAFAEASAGTYLLTVSLAQQAYRLSAFCRSLMLPESRAAFRADEEGAMRRFGLNDTEIAMVRARDWLAMVRYGVNH